MKSKVLNPEYQEKIRKMLEKLGDRPGRDPRDTRITFEEWVGIKGYANVLGLTEEEMRGAVKRLGLTLPKEIDDRPVTAQLTPDGVVHLYNVPPERVGKSSETGNPLVKIEKGDFDNAPQGVLDWLDANGNRKVTVLFHITDGRTAQATVDALNNFIPPRAATKSTRTWTTLADDASDPSNYSKVQSIAPATLHKEIRRYKVLTLDDDATRAALTLADSTPKSLADMLHAAVPPWDRLWIEVPSRAVVEHRRQHARSVGAKYAAETPPDHARVGLQITYVDDDPGPHVKIHCFEHEAGSRRVWEWPIGFDIGLGDTKFPRPPRERVSVTDDKTHALIRGTDKIIRQTSAIWGYEEETKGLSNLNYRGRVGVAPHWMKMVTMELVSSTLKEVHGIPRLAVAVLSMLNTVMSVDPGSRPKGRRLSSSSRNKTLPYLERSVGYLNISPRIKKVNEYIAKAVSDEVSRKRYHEVRGHYRHVREKPSTPGWEECIVRGQTMWRKRIAPHHRGDIELGIVEHDVTVVVGRKD